MISVRGLIPQARPFAFTMVPRVDGAKSEVTAVDLAAVDIALLLEPATVDARLVGLVLVAVDGGQTSTLASRYLGDKPLMNARAA